MSLTKKQLEVADHLANGGYIWKAGSSYYLSVVTGHTSSGAPSYQSRPMNARTFAAMEPLLKKDMGDRERWRLK